MTEAELDALVSNLLSSAEHDPGRDVVAAGVISNLRSTLAIVKRREVDNILAMTDEEIIAEVRENDDDPAAVAAHVRAIFERVAARYRN
jgi:hypothetical protein